MKAELIEQVRIAPGTTPGLPDRDPGARLGLGGKKDGHRYRDTLLTELADLQALLWAEDRRAVLLVLQGMDTAGKDGTIRRIFSGVNPQGVRVAGFKAPSDNELDHDYLWRVHRVVPRRGELGIFNRSHYEDVAVVRVLDLVEEARWRARFRHIREFERLLHDEGTTVLKVFLHISRDEQRERLQARIDDPAKRWKFNHDDIDMRARWDDFTAAYEEAIAETSSDWASWYVVPADRKWVRDAVIAELLVSTLRGMDLQRPAAPDDLEGLVIP
jgi:PPK2 family polyphosphate:nucleotide phosphotransferase